MQQLSSETSSFLTLLSLGKHETTIMFPKIMIIDLAVHHVLFVARDSCRVKCLQWQECHSFLILTVLF